MSDFFKKFLLEDPRKTSYGGRTLTLAVFGKHPGWDDHIEPLPGKISSADLGLETDSLNLAKTVLYVNGIGGQIDSGAWEKLDATQLLPEFHHIFVWQRSGQILVGRMWSSSDGKGRKRYPMVVCAHLSGVPLGWALKHVLPALADVESGCIKTSSSDDVRVLLNRKRAALREAIQSADGRNEYAPMSPEVLRQILRPAGAAIPEDFLRVLYQSQSQLGAFAAGTFNARANSATVRAQQIRVPVAGKTPEEALLFWTRFFLTQIDPSVPFLLMLPLDAGWMDVTVGEPKSHEFFCLRASPKAVPMVSEVPYTLDDAFRSGATAFLQKLEGTPVDVPDAKPIVAPSAGSPVPARSSWMKWFGLAVVVFGVAGLIVMLPKKRITQTGVELLRTNSSVAKFENATVAGSKNPETALETKRKDSETEGVRAAEEKKKTEALAADKLRIETEIAAREKEEREKESQMAEAARIEREKAALKQKELLAQQRKAEEETAAKKKAAEDARAKQEVVSTTKPPDSNRATTPSSAGVTDEMTNGIGMVLVRLSSELWVGKFEVTQAEFTEVMGDNPSKSKNNRQPVEWVTWKTANDFCTKLTERERPRLRAGQRYSLPTERQWTEYRGGQKFEDIPGGVTGKTGPSIVGQSGSPNRFGLYDVLGNVWEWCLDAPDDRKLKGGAFNSANYEQPLPLGGKGSNCGFRCVLTSQ